MAMNKRKAKKMRKKQDMFAMNFATSYRGVREFDRSYHEFVVADRRRRFYDELVLLDKFVEDDNINF